MKAIHSSNEYTVDRFLDLMSKIPDGRLTSFRSKDWNLPYNVGPNKDVARSLFKKAYKDTGILDDYDLEDWDLKDLDPDEYVISIRNSEEIGIAGIAYDNDELAEQLETLINSIIIDRPKQLEMSDILSPGKKEKKEEDNFDIPKMIDWHEI